MGDPKLVKTLRDLGDRNDALVRWRVRLGANSIAQAPRWRPCSGAPFLIGRSECRQSRLHGKSRHIGAGPESDATTSPRTDRPYFVDELERDLCRSSPGPLRAGLLRRLRSDPRATAGVWRSRLHTAPGPPSKEGRPEDARRKTHEPETQCSASHARLETSSFVRFKHGLAGVDCAAAMKRAHPLVMLWI